ncbi:hypothetical protein C8F04DRAFT_1228916 [Mycena alexandri]|uniref:Uncharacterized protein n=1 Tax=Mycena alexandri TaxID=1745969 RepID=A0AAD6TEW4_9AGAR|nr:hypothetical protein C8F04DRAFT_1228916 [Mycena alexandri]
MLFHYPRTRPEASSNAAAAQFASPAVTLLPEHKLTHVVKSNDAPLDSEIPFIRDFVSNEQNRVVTLYGQIESLQSTLVQLTQKRGEAVERVRQHRAVISAVRQMPPELLCEIFVSRLLDSSANADDEIQTEPPWYFPVLEECGGLTPRPLGFHRVQLLRSGDADLDIHLLDVRAKALAQLDLPRGKQPQMCATLVNGRLD